MRQSIGRILLSENEIFQRVQELGRRISDDYRGEKITIVCVLKGAVVFLADLLRNLDMPADLDFIQVSSYGDETKSTGVAKIIQGLTVDVTGRHVLIVDDIADSGLTLRHLKESLLSKRPASVKLCVLLDKAARRTQSLKIDYVGFEIPDEFVIGYGLDYAGRYRGLRYIATLALPQE